MPKMDRKEVKKIISYLLVGLPETDLGNSPEATLKIWENIIEVFPYKVAEEAAKEYLRRFHKFTCISDFVKICDEVWQKVEREQREQEAEDNREAAKFLFQKPISTIKDDYVRKSVELIRDVCEDRIKYNSPEWISRFEGIYGKGAMHNI